MPQSLLRVEKRLPDRAVLANTLRSRAEVLSLGYEDRRRSRLRARLVSGKEIALLLPRGTVLVEGDMLVAANGTLIRVEAKQESVLEITHPDPAVLQRVAYHLGNRHVPVQLGATRLRLAFDSVLADLAVTLGAEVVTLEASFEPESGAYGGGHRHGHADTFAEDDALAKQSFAVHWSDGLDAGEELHLRHQSVAHPRFDQHRPGHHDDSHDDDHDHCDHHHGHTHDAKE
jgi:urease accessory protein